MCTFRSETIIQQALDRLKDVGLALSSYDPRTDIYRLNHDLNTAIQNDTYEVLLRSIRYYAESDGRFNIAIGSITKGLYHFGEDEKIPEEHQRFIKRAPLKTLSIVT